MAKIQKSYKGESSQILANTMFLYMHTNTILSLLTIVSVFWRTILINSIVYFVKFTLLYFLKFCLASENCSDKRPLTSCLNTMLVECAGQFTTQKNILEEVQRVSWKIMLNELDPFITRCARD